MRSKNIWHVGGYNKNFGDFVLLESIRQNLSSISDIPLNFMPIDCQNTHFFEKIIDRMNSEADMLLIGGGGFVFNRQEDNSLSGWQWSIKTEDIKKIKIPVVVYGIGFNKFFGDNRDFKPQMNKNLIETQNIASLFSVRNSGTKKELICRGLRGDKIDVIPDAGSFLKPKEIYVPQLNNSRLKIGVNFVSDRPYYTYPKDSEKTKLFVFNNLIEVCKYLINNYNAIIVNIEHILEIDKPTNAYFKEKLGKENYLSLAEDFGEIYPPSLLYAPYLVDIYRQMDFVIGMRGHSNIIAFGVETPFVAMGSHNKNKFFLNEINEDKYLIDIRNYTECCTKEFMISKFEDLKNDIEYKNRVHSKKMQLKNKFDLFNKKIINLLR